MVKKKKIVISIATLFFTFIAIDVSVATMRTNQVAIEQGLGDDKNSIVDKETGLVLSKCDDKYDYYSILDIPKPKDADVSFCARTDEYSGACWVQPLGFLDGKYKARACYQDGILGVPQCIDLAAGEAYGRWRAESRYFGTLDIGYLGGYADDDSDCPDVKNNINAVGYNFIYEATSNGYADENDFFNNYCEPMAENYNPGNCESATFCPCDTEECRKNKFMPKTSSDTWKNASIDVKNCYLCRQPSRAVRYYCRKVYQCLKKNEGEMYRIAKRQNREKIKKIYGKGNYVCAYYNNVLCGCAKTKLSGGPRHFLRIARQDDTEIKSCGTKEDIQSHPQCNLFGSSIFVRQFYNKKFTDDNSRCPASHSAEFGYKKRGTFFFPKLVVVAGKNERLIGYAYDKIKEDPAYYYNSPIGTATEYANYNTYSLPTAKKIVYSNFYPVVFTIGTTYQMLDDETGGCAEKATTLLHYIVLRLEYNESTNESALVAYKMTPTNYIPPSMSSSDPKLVSSDGSILKFVATNSSFIKKVTEQFTYDFDPNQNFPNKKMEVKTNYLMFENIGKVKRPPLKYSYDEGTSYITGPLILENDMNEGSVDDKYAEKVKLSIVPSNLKAVNEKEFADDANLPTETKKLSVSGLDSSAYSIVGGQLDTKDTNDITDSTLIYMKHFSVGYTNPCVRLRTITDTEGLKNLKDPPTDYKTCINSYTDSAENMLHCLYAYLLVNECNGYVSCLSDKTSIEQCKAEDRTPYIKINGSDNDLQDYKINTDFRSIARICVTDGFEFADKLSDFSNTKLFGDFGDPIYDYTIRFQRPYGSRFSTPTRSLSLAGKDKIIHQLNDYQDKINRIPTMDINYFSSNKMNRFENLVSRLKGLRIVNAANLPTKETLYEHYASDCMYNASLCENRFSVSHRLVNETNGRLCVDANRLNGGAWSLVDRDVATDYNVYIPLRCQYIFFEGQGAGGAGMTTESKTHCISQFHITMMSWMGFEINFGLFKISISLPILPSLAYRRIPKYDATGSEGGNVQVVIDVNKIKVFDGYLDVSIGARTKKIRAEIPTHKDPHSCFVGTGRLSTVTDKTKAGSSWIALGGTHQFWYKNGENFIGHGTGDDIKTNYGNVSMDKKKGNTEIGFNTHGVAKITGHAQKDYYEDIATKASANLNEAKAKIETSIEQLYNYKIMDYYFLALSARAQRLFYADLALHQTKETVYTEFTNDVKKVYDAKKEVYDSIKAQECSEEDKIDDVKKESCADIDRQIAEAKAELDPVETQYNACVNQTLGCYTEDEIRNYNITGKSGATLVKDYFSFITSNIDNEKNDWVGDNQGASGHISHEKDEVKYYVCKKYEYECKISGSYSDKKDYISKCMSTPSTSSNNCDNIVNDTEKQTCLDAIKNTNDNNVTITEDDIEGCEIENDGNIVDLYQGAVSFYENFSSKLEETYNKKVDLLDTLKYITPPIDITIANVEEVLNTIKTDFNSVYSDAVAFVTSNDFLYVGSDKSNYQSALDTIKSFYDLSALHADSSAAFVAGKSLNGLTSGKKFSYEHLANFYHFALAMCKANHDDSSKFIPSSSCLETEQYQQAHRQEPTSNNLPQTYSGFIKVMQGISNINNNERTAGKTKNDIEKSISDDIKLYNENIDKLKFANSQLAILSGGSASSGSDNYQQIAVAFHGVSPIDCRVNSDYSKENCPYIDNDHIRSGMYRSIDSPCWWNVGWKGVFPQYGCGNCGNSGLYKIVDNMSASDQLWCLGLEDIVRYKSSDNGGMFEYVKDYLIETKLLVSGDMYPKTMKGTGSRGSTNADSQIELKEYEWGHPEFRNTSYTSAQSYTEIQGKYNAYNNTAGSGGAFIHRQGAGAGGKGYANLSVGDVHISQSQNVHSDYYPNLNNDGTKNIAMKIEGTTKADVKCSVRCPPIYVKKTNFPLYFESIDDVREVDLICEYIGTPETDMEATTGKTIYPSKCYIISDLTDDVYGKLYGKIIIGEGMCPIAKCENSTWGFTELAPGVEKAQAQYDRKANLCKAKYTYDGIIKTPWYYTMMFDKNIYSSMAYEGGKKEVLTATLLDTLKAHSIARCANNRASDYIIDTYSQLQGDALALSCNGGFWQDAHITKKPTENDLYALQHSYQGHTFPDNGKDIHTNTITDSSDEKRDKEYVRNNHDMYNTEYLIKDGTNNVGGSAMTGIKKLSSLGREVFKNKVYCPPIIDTYDFDTDYSGNATWTETAEYRTATGVCKTNDSANIIFTSASGSPTRTCMRNGIWGPIFNSCLQGCPVTIDSNGTKWSMTALGNDWQPTDGQTLVDVPGACSGTYYNSQEFTSLNSTDNTLTRTCNLLTGNWALESSIKGDCSDTLVCLNDNYAGKYVAVPFVRTLTLQQKQNGYRVLKNSIETNKVYLGDVSAIDESLYLPFNAIGTSTLSDNKYYVADNNYVSISLEEKTIAPDTSSMYVVDGKGNRLFDYTGSSNYYVLSVKTAVSPEAFNYMLAQGNAMRNEFENITNWISTLVEDNQNFTGQWEWKANMSKSYFRGITQTTAGDMQRRYRNAELLVFIQKLSETGSKATEYKKINARRIALFSPFLARQKYGDILSLNDDEKNIKFRYPFKIDADDYDNSNDPFPVVLFNGLSSARVYRFEWEKNDGDWTETNNANINRHQIGTRNCNGKYVGYIAHNTMKHTMYTENPLANGKIYFTSQFCYDGRIFGYKTIKVGFAQNTILTDSDTSRIFLNPTKNGDHFAEILFDAKIRELNATEAGRRYVDSDDFNTIEQMSYIGGMMMKYWKAHILPTDDEIATFMANYNPATDTSPDRASNEMVKLILQRYKDGSSGKYYRVVPRRAEWVTGTAYNSITSIDQLAELDDVDPYCEQTECKTKKANADATITNVIGDNTWKMCEV